MISLGILFGQRAQSLERGNSYSNLIKTGCNQSIIKVVINNYLKFRPDLYGHTIIIEKKLRLNLTKLSIYHERGKIFKLTRNELESIKEKYNLKFENPLNFLTQENSKKFLNTCKPEHLYDLYYRGTEFKYINEKLASSQSIIEELLKKLEETQNKRTTIESELQKKIKALEFLKYDPELELERLEIEEKWVNINCKKEKVKEYEKSISELQNNVLELKKEIEIMNGNKFEFDEKSTQELEDEISKLLLQCHSIENEYNEYLKEKKDTELEIIKIKNKSKMDQIRTDLKEYEDLLNNKNIQINDLEKQKEVFFHLAQEEKIENSEKDKKKYALSKQIEYLKRNAHDPNIELNLNNFKRIDEELKKHRFKDVVIGPICKHINLEDSKWYKPVSIVLKRSLENYIVFNSEDKVTLYNIFKGLKINYTILHASSKNICLNFSKNKKYTTIYDILNSDEKLVLSQLVTLNGIEQIILIEDRDLAHDIIRSNPRNVECAYLKTGDRIKMQNGSLSDFRQKDDGVYWFEDKTSKISKLEAELKDNTPCYANKKKYEQIVNQIGYLQKEIHESEKSIENLKYELETIESMKENGIVGHEKKLIVLERSIGSLFNRKNNLSEILKEKEDILKNIREENTNQRIMLKNVKEKHDQRLKEIEYNILACENTKSIKIKEIAILKEQLEKDLQNAKAEPKSLRRKEDILEERKRIYNFKAQAKEMEPKENIQKSISILEKDLSFIMGLEEKCRKSYERSNMTLNKRILKKDELKDKTTIESIEAFQKYTMRNGYLGEMDIDHENKRLDIRMRIHNSAISGSKSTLSGGERSFAFVCFLLSMWKCFNCPIKILDEFDVFMDTLNRRMAIRALFEFFKSSNIQVILITPLDTEDLIDPDCDIIILQKKQSS